MIGWIKNLFRPKKRMYAAAKTTRLTSSWLESSRPHNDIIRASSPALRARARQLVRDFPPFQRALNALTDFTVGNGARFQSLALTPRGKADKKLRSLIEERFNAWCKKADITGRLTFGEVQRLAHRQMTEVGESLMVWSVPLTRGRSPLALAIYEPECLSDLVKTTRKEATQAQGVEFLTQTGEPLAYWITPNPIDQYGVTSIFGPVRVPAEDVIHTFRTLRPGQLRGVSPFAAALLLAKDLDDFLGAEIDAAKMAAKWLAFVTSPNPAEFQALRVEEENGQKVESVENAILEYLRPGEQINFASSQRPGNNFEPFVKFILRLIAIACDAPYELISGDYSGLNYTTLRGVRNDFKQSLAPAQQLVIDHVCQPVFERWLDYAVMSGEIRVNDYWSNRNRYVRGSWIPVGIAPVDPQKEITADIEGMEKGLFAPQDIIMKYGKDPEETLDKIAAWKELCGERGLTFQEAAQGAAKEIFGAKKSQKPGEDEEDPVEVE